MAYNVNSFLLSNDPTDLNIVVTDIFGNTTVIKSFNINNMFIMNNLVKIKLKSTDNVIILDFDTRIESLQALDKLRIQWKNAIANKPNIIDTDIHNYILSATTSIIVGTPSQILYYNNSGNLSSDGGLIRSPNEFGVAVGSFSEISYIFIGDNSGVINGLFGTQTATISNLLIYDEGSNNRVSALLVDNNINGYVRDNEGLSEIQFTVYNASASNYYYFGTFDWGSSSAVGFGVYGTFNSNFIVTTSSIGWSVDDYEFNLPILDSDAGTVITTDGEGNLTFTTPYIQNIIFASQSIYIPSGSEYFVYGNLQIDGSLYNSGSVIIANGDLIVGTAGTYSNWGTMQFIKLLTSDDIGLTGPTGATGIGMTGATGSDGPIGATGSDGPIGATGTSFTWQGTWDSGLTYSTNDLVETGGTSYIMIQTLPSYNVYPPLNPSWWDVVAQSGITGSTGATGPTPYTNPPLGLTGAPGDLMGNFAIDSNYIYYCTQSFTPIISVTLSVYLQWSGQTIYATYTSDQTLIGLGWIVTEAFDTFGNPLTIPIGTTVSSITLDMAGSIFELSQALTGASFSDGGQSPNSIVVVAPTETYPIIWKELVMPGITATYSTGDGRIATFTNGILTGLV